VPSDIVLMFAGALTYSVFQVRTAAACACMSPLNQSPLYGRPFA
jgi:hypothetical protein